MNYWIETLITVVGGIIAAVIVFLILPQGQNAPPLLAYLGQARSRRERNISRLNAAEARLFARDPAAFVRMYLYRACAVVLLGVGSFAFMILFVETETHRLPNQWPTLPLWLYSAGVDALPFASVAGAVLLFFALTTVISMWSKQISPDVAEISRETREDDHQ
jgi:hypothetical protein